MFQIQNTRSLERTRNRVRRREAGQPAVKTQCLKKRVYTCLHNNDVQLQSNRNSVMTELGFIAECNPINDIYYTLVSLSHH